MFINFHCKRAYVFSLTALIVAVLLFAYLNSEFNDPKYLSNQERIDIRISQLDKEFLFVKESVIPQAVRFSTYYATKEFLNITLSNETFKNSLNNSHSNVQNVILNLAINGSFNNEFKPSMENRTVEYLMSYYEDFFEDSLISNFTYSINNGRVYEKTPLYISVQMEIDLLLRAEELDLEISDTKTVDVSFSVEEFRDPYLALNINDSTAEELALERSSPTYGGEWTWELFNDTYENGYVTTFVFPEYKYTLGTSFLRSFTNSTQRGLYKDIISFLSFQYEQDSTPYDTNNFNYSHLMYTDTLFIATFDNTSSSIDETNYGHSLFPSPTNCNVSGVSGNACEITTPTEIVDLSISPNSSAISFWINYSGSGIIFNSSSLDIETNSTKQSLTIRGERDSLSDFVINNVSLTPNRWNNIIIHARDNSLDFLINAEKRYSQYIEGSFESFENITLSNAEFDEITIINRSISNTEISRLTNERESQFLEYKNSLHTTGLGLYGYEEIDLSLSHVLNKSFNEFGVEFWYRASEIDSSFRVLRLENSTTSDFFEINLNSTNVEISSNSFNQISSNFDFDNNEYRQILIQLTNSNMLEVYVNTQLIMNVSFTDTIANYSHATLLDNSSKLQGVFDEFVLYNTSFFKNEIEEHYFNFESVVGGCCNYFKIYNENTHGVPVPDNNSISSPMVTNWDKFNLTLVTTRQKNSSFPSSASWYEKYVDPCIIYVYNLNNYVNTSDSDGVKPGDIGFTCQELIKEGIY